MTSVALSNGGALIASASSTFAGNLRVWDVAQAQYSPSLATGLAAVQAVAFTPAGDLLTAGSDASGLPLVELRRAGAYDTVVASWRGHGVSSVHALAVSADGTRIAAAGDGFVAILDASLTPALFQDAGYAAHMIAFVGGADLVAASDDAGDLRFFDAGAARLADANLAGGPKGMAIDREGTRLVAAGDDGVLRLYQCVRAAK
jgi:WD40 repeat protein